MRKPKFVGVPFVLFGLAWVVIMALLVFGLWNALMPSLFGLHAVTLWQALGLFVLSRVLIGGFGGWGHRMRKARFVRRWNDLTPEERERFQQAMGSRCSAA